MTQRMARTHCVELLGLEGRVVEVEAAVGGGLPRVVMVGLPDTSLYESRDRCKAVATGQQLGWPDRLVTINLSPASLPKGGTHYDLAVMTSVLAADGRIPPGRIESLVMLGEVGLDGRIRAVRGLLPAVMGAVQAGYRQVIVPKAQVREARLAPGCDAVGVESVAELVGFLRGELVPDDRCEEPTERDVDMLGEPDFAEVLGQMDARWAVEVAAAGGHHVFLTGPPGVGKSMLASRIPTILPPLSVDEALEVAAVRSLARVGDAQWSMTPPWSNPHHSASMQSLLGGGARVPVPGAISLAHRGVLFLDEAPEFQRNALEALREPLESGEILVSRSVHQARYPARFQLVLAANPCPCGFAGSPGSTCRCGPAQIRRYREKLSGPILDRIDIRQELLPLGPTLMSMLSLESTAESSALVGARVREARERQARRLAGTGWRTNAEVPGSYIRTEWPRPEGMRSLDTYVRRSQLSARGIDRVVRVAWTIADLAGRDRPGRADVLEAVALRLGARERESA